MLAAEALGDVPPEPSREQDQHVDHFQTSEVHQEAEQDLRHAGDVGLCARPEDDPGVAEGGYGQDHAVGEVDVLQEQDLHGPAYQGEDEQHDRGQDRGSLVRIDLRTVDLHDLDGPGVHDPHHSRGYVGADGHQAAYLDTSRGRSGTSSDELDDEQEQEGRQGPEQVVADGEPGGRPGGDDGVERYPDALGVTFPDVEEVGGYQGAADDEPADHGGPLVARLPEDLLLHDAEDRQEEVRSTEDHEDEGHQLDGEPESRHAVGERQQAPGGHVGHRDGHALPSVEVGAVGAGEADEEQYDGFDDGECQIHLEEVECRRPHILAVVGAPGYELVGCEVLASDADHRQQVDEHEDGGDTAHPFDGGPPQEDGLGAGLEHLGREDGRPRGGEPGNALVDRVLDVHPGQQERDDGGEHAQHIGLRYQQDPQ